MIVCLPGTIDDDGNRLCSSCARGPGNRWVELGLGTLCDACGAIASVDYLELSFWAPPETGVAAMAQALARNGR